MPSSARSSQLFSSSDWPDMPMWTRLWGKKVYLDRWGVMGMRGRRNEMVMTGGIILAGYSYVSHPSPISSKVP